MSNSSEAIGYGTVGQLEELMKQMKSREVTGQTLLGEATWVPGATVIRTPTEEKVECAPNSPAYTVRVGITGVIDFRPY